MKGGKSPLGYTIVEVMIVLAVSGLMFIVAANFINGKQEQTSFTEGVNELASNTQNLINQVKNGKYSDIPISCTASGGSLTISSPGSSTTTQGQNAECTFLGKVLHVTGNNSPNYEVFTIAGERLSGGVPVTDLNSAMPTPVAAPFTSTNPINLTTQEIAPQNLFLEYILVNGNQYSEIGFIQYPGNSDGAGGLQNGPQTIDLYYVNGSSLGLSSTTAAATKITSANLMPVHTASICVTDNHKYADIVIGTSGDQLNVTVNNINTSSC